MKTQSPVPTEFGVLVMCEVDASYQLIAFWRRRMGRCNKPTIQTWSLKSSIRAQMTPSVSRSTTTHLDLFSSALERVFSPMVDSATVASGDAR